MKRNIVIVIISCILPIIVATSSITVFMYERSDKYVKTKEQQEKVPEKQSESHETSSVQVESIEGKEIYNEAHLDHNEDEALLERQGLSLETYFLVIEELRKNKDTFGGTYLDDNGDLNVLFVNNSKISNSGQSVVEIYKNILASHIQENQNVIYREVKYTIDQLTTIQDKLMDNVTNLVINSTYIDESMNLIVVGYCNNNFDSNRVIDFVGDSNCLIFRKSNYLPD